MLKSAYPERSGHGPVLVYPLPHESATSLGRAVQAVQVRYLKPAQMPSSWPFLVPTPANRLRAAEVSRTLRRLVARAFFRRRGRCPIQFPIQRLTGQFALGGPFVTIKLGPVLL